MTDRVDELFARYVDVAERMERQGPDSLTDDDFRLIAAVSSAMYQAATWELERRAAGPLWDTRHIYNTEVPGPEGTH